MGESGFTYVLHCVSLHHVCIVSVCSSMTKDELTIEPEKKTAFKLTCFIKCTVRVCPGFNAATENSMLQM